MTYEEKLQKIISRLKDERDLTRKSHKTKVTFDDRSFTKPRIRDICKILLQLQDDEHILQIIEGYKAVSEESYGKITDNDYEQAEFLTIELDKEFDEWYENYLIKEKCKLENLSEINFNNIAHIVSLIEQQLELSQSREMVISFVSSVHEIEGYEREDIDDMIYTFKQGLEYLKNIGAIESYTTEDFSLSSEITINTPALFETLEKIKKIKQAKSTTQTAIIPTKQKATKKNVNYDSKRGILEIDSKRVVFKKDSFRAKLLELLLKDDQSRKKEWSWDEVIEEIEDTKGKEATRENKKKFYPACDGLSKFIAQKTGINDLLIFNKSTVQVNPKYL